MKFKIAKLAVASAIVGVLGFGGASLAFAQTAHLTTPTGPAPAAHGHGGPDCPNMGGSGPGPSGPNPQL